jgi:AraC-like DNA-binding protein
MHSANSLTVRQDRALYLGGLEATGEHAHVCPALLVGLSGPFQVRMGAGVTFEGRSAVVDAGLPHVFDPVGEDVAVMYLEPDTAEARALRPLLAAHGGLLADPLRPVRARDAARARLQVFDVAALMRSRLAEATPLDARIARALALLRQPALRPAARGELAQAAGLSASHFNHLFSAEMGVSFRSYRVWSQIRSAMSVAGPRTNLTHAAMEGAFADSSHFSRHFRQAFGMTPSSLLRQLSRA